jgi:hypothetical protein
LFGALLDFNLYPAVAHLVANGWLPLKAQGAYLHLLNHKPYFDHMFLEARTGLLRPMASLVIFGAAYIAYQKHKDFLLRRTGSFVNTMGRDTLWIFAAQALVIPILAAVPLPRNILMNFIVTSFLISLMWLVAKRRAMVGHVRAYLGELKDSYSRAKYSYLYQSENDI